MSLTRNPIHTCSAGGPAAFLLALALLWVGQGMQMASNFWLSIWSDKNLSGK